MVELRLLASVRKNFKFLFLTLEEVNLLSVLRLGYHFGIEANSLSSNQSSTGLSIVL
jgi:hypothetical protein